MSHVACYIDGFNLYHAIRELDWPELKWVNLERLARSYLGATDDLVSVVYFTAVLNWSAEKASRHRQYLRALQAYGVDIVESRFQKVARYCRLNTRYCDFHEEKQTDVAFAVRVLRDATAELAQRVILVTADTDHVPLVLHLREAHPLISVEVAAPPGRLQRARQLCRAASHFGEISQGRLRTCLLPREVLDATGKVVARCPARYIPR